MLRISISIVFLCLAPLAYSQADLMNIKPNLKDPCKSKDTDVDECFIDVLVTEKTLGGVKDCWVELKDPVEQDLVDIKKGRRVTLVWRIHPDSAKGYRFTQSGIQFLNNDPPRQFVRPELSADGQLFSWVNRNGRRQIYEYVISVKGGEGSNLGCDLHPWIRNR